MTQVVHALLPKPLSDAVVERDGRVALLTSNGGIEVPGAEELGDWPITVELIGFFTVTNTPLVTLGRFDTYLWRVLVGMGGDLAVLMRGYDPFASWTGGSLIDAAWHHLAFTCDGAEARLLIDGRVLHHWKPQWRAAFYSTRTPLYVGTDPDQGGQSASALITQVRVSNVVRSFDAAPGDLIADTHTIGLWHVKDTTPQGLVPDRSGRGRDGRLLAMEQTSLDERDRRHFAAGAAPWQAAALSVSLQAGVAHHPDASPVLSLDGQWELAEGLADFDRIGMAWTDTLPAPVPASVHTALLQAGLIPDPTFGRNDREAHEKSFSTWWYRRRFTRPAGTGHRLIFDGVAVHAAVWLNGAKLGEHEGMFGGPAFDIDPLLREDNDLIVRISPAPLDCSFFAKRDNSGWRKTVVFNNVYGWHYCNIPALGIWRSVRVTSAPAVKLDHPFVVTHDAQLGRVSLCVELAGAATGWRGRLVGTVAPDNFSGTTCHFTVPVEAAGTRSLNLAMQIPDPRPWWPNGMGEPNLYRLTLSFVPEGDGAADTCSTTFGLRTIQMRPLPSGVSPCLYNWTFVINGQERFIKGAGWCTLDALMDFRRERYERFLRLARQQHCQMVRAWGAGMPETDDFYDLCDRLGLLVMQEWPTAWNSHAVQPYEALEETVRLNTLRLRNHPSLAMWGGGNESSDPTGKAIDMMGRLAIELDGTRPFHRGEPWGGSRHDYGCWWGRGHLDHNLKMTAPFWGEFGIASFPSHESVQRYLPAEQRDLWPAPDDGVLAHHTPIFNTRDDMDRLRQYAGYFSACPTLERTILASQVAQAVALRHTLERARTRWPHCTGALYYKLNDNYPAASWSIADWYGAVKITHWFCKSAFAPLHACVLPESLNFVGQAVALPVFLLDDAGSLRGKRWRVTLRALDAALRQVAMKAIDGTGDGSPVLALGEWSLTPAQTQSTPLLLVAETFVEDALADRSYSFFNVEAVKDCLFNLLRTQLQAQCHGGMATVTNQGALAAVGVTLAQPGHADTFLPADNCFWLEPGESRSIDVNQCSGLTVGAWNADAVPVG